MKRSYSSQDIRDRYPRIDYHNHAFFAEQHDQRGCKNPPSCEAAEIGKSQSVSAGKPLKKSTSNPADIPKKAMPK